MMKRESGYYWVKLGNEWHVAEYVQNSSLWYLTGSSTGYEQRHFTEIGERVERGNGWVKCSERQPPIGDEYIVVWELDDGQPPVSASMDWDFKKQIWTDPRGADPTQPINDKILYWQPLPTPPTDSQL